jgi:hypothetical protein
MDLLIKEELGIFELLLIGQFTNLTKKQEYAISMNI